MGSAFLFHVQVVRLSDGTLSPFTCAALPPGSTPPGVFRAFEEGPRQGHNLQHVATLQTFEDAEGLRRQLERVVRCWGLAPSLSLPG